MFRCFDFFVSHKILFNLLKTDAPHLGHLWKDIYSENVDEYLAFHLPHSIIKRKHNLCTQHKNVCGFIQWNSINFQVKYQVVVNCLPFTCQPHKQNEDNRQKLLQRLYYSCFSICLIGDVNVRCVCIYIFNFIHLQNRHRQTNCCQLHLNSCVLLVLPMCLYGVSSTSDNVATQPLSMWMCTPSVYIYILMPFLRIQFVTK